MTIHAQGLSCQGLTDVDRVSEGAVPTFHGEPVDGYTEEMARRGEGHVFGCELIGHMADETGRS